MNPPKSILLLIVYAVIGIALTLLYAGVVWVMRPLRRLVGLKDSKHPWM